MSMVPEQLTYAIEVWSSDGNRIEEVMARVSHGLVALAAFEAACREREGRYLTLRKGTRVIREQRPPPKPPGTPRLDALRARMAKQTPESS